MPVCLNLDISETVKNEKKGVVATIEIGGINDMGSYVLSFKCMPENWLFAEKIELSTLVYKYNSLVPHYINAKYAPDVYDIKKFIY